MTDHHVMRPAHAASPRDELTDLLDALDEHRRRLGRSIDSIEAMRIVAARTPAGRATISGLKMRTVLAYSSAALRTCEAEIGTLVDDVRRDRHGPSGEERPAST